MPRCLSLKKPQSAGSSKNQTSITSFLKSTRKPPGDNQVSPVKNQKHDIEPHKSTKRKALSPMIVDKINFEESETTTYKKKLKNCSNTPKKIKTEYNKKSPSPLKKGIPSPYKKSPNKENTLDKYLSPMKKVTEDLELPHSSVNGKKHETYNTRDKLQEQSCVAPKVSEGKIIMEKAADVHINQELSIFQSCKSENYGTIKVTPVKQQLSENGKKNSQSPIKRNKTPKKSPMQEFICSPIFQQKTPDKSPKDVTSPSKSGSTVKILDFNMDNICDDFADEWEMEDIEEEFIEDLDLSTMQRCEILSVTKSSCRTELRLKNSHNNKATCHVEGIWMDTPLLPGDIVSVLASRDLSGHYSVNNSSGLLVLRPDHLVSSTSVVAGVFCKRKAVLQERWRGIDSANMAMTTGIMIHELVQRALTQNISSIQQLRAITDAIIKESIERLYDAGLSEQEAKSNMQNYIPPLADFMNTYVAEKPPNIVQVQKDKNNWSGHIDKILDIEENLCCPNLGLKGKIDATLQVTIHERKGRQHAVVPLELKSGKASMSAEHRGQLVLYGMMLSLQNCEDPTVATQRGLLLYLKDKVELREVSCGYPERRDLIMLRNQLVQYLSASPHDIDHDKLADIEDASVMLQQKLPEPVDHHNACAKCPYLTLCSLHLWHTDGPSVSETHPLSKLRNEALGHLSQDHIKYFLHWTALLKMEERLQSTSSPLHALWTDSIVQREKRGTCAPYLKLKRVQSTGDRHLHIFLRKSVDNAPKQDAKVTKGPQEGEFSIVSIENRPWIAAGVVTVANAKEIHIILERDLTRRLNRETTYNIDTYESYATTVQNLTNLGVLMEDSDRAELLRQLIIDAKPPHFSAKPPRDAGRLASKLFRALNIQQQRAVLKALTATDYVLLRGLPGTGKTQTISVLIQMLVALKMRVLVTAHTHSAVDTVLTRIAGSVLVMRLGSASRVAAALSSRTEQVLTADCDTPEQLAQLYDSMEVVGVTCLGANHAMLSRITFDVCIVDEATQVLQSTILRPLFAAKRFVLVGDPEQLPPVVRSRAARRLGMEESLFHRLMREKATSTLQLQYRMNQSIVDIANIVAYSGKLKCADQKIAEATLAIDMQKISHLTSQSLWLAAACSPALEHAVLFIDVEPTDDVTNAPTSKNSCNNPTEACVVLALVEALKQGNIKCSDIGIIAPYREQVSLLRRATQHVEVSTVDQFQGRDKCVIIYSCTRRASPQDHKVKEGEVLNDPRRLAVSVTRAKHKFLIIGNSSALQRYSSLQTLIKTCNSIKLDKKDIASVQSKFKTLVT